MRRRTYHPSEQSENAAIKKHQVSDKLILLERAHKTKRRGIQQMGYPLKEWREGEEIAGGEANSRRYEKRMDP